MEGSFVNVLVVRKMRLRFDLFRARDRHERRPVKRILALILTSLWPTFRRHASLHRRVEEDVRGFLGGCLSLHYHTDIRPAL